MIVRFLPRAEGDLESIRSYLIERSPQGANNVGASIERGIQFIADHPLGGTKIKPPLFAKVLTDYPYKIFYRVCDGYVEILHIRHAARRQWHD